MSIITGRDAYVNNIPCTTSWSVNRASSAARYAASCTGKGTAVNKGVKNVTGSISGIGGNPPLIPGENFTFKGVIDNTVSANKTLDGTIFIQNLQITIPKETGGNITWTAAFGAQGDLTEGTTGAADATYTLHEGAADAADAVLYDGGTPYTIPGYRQANFTITSPEKPYVQNGLTYRKGGNLEADISIDVYDDDYINAKFEPGKVDKLSLFIDASNAWIFEWIRFTGISNMTFNRETQDLVGYSITGMWTAVSAGVLGHITRPSGAHLFGT